MCTDYNNDMYFFKWNTTKCCGCTYKKYKNGVSIDMDIDIEMYIHIHHIMIFMYMDTTI